MNKTTYWCDRCGLEVAGDLNYIQIQSERASDMRPSRQYLELCDDCKTAVLDAVSAEMANAGTPA